MSLPGYGLATYLQKACSALRRMILFAVAECIAGTIQIVLCLWLTPVFGLNFVGFSSTFFFVSIDLVILLFLRRELGRIGMRDMVVAFLRAFALGAAGAVGGRRRPHGAAGVRGAARRRHGPGARLRRRRRPARPSR